METITGPIVFNITHYVRDEVTQSKFEILIFITFLKGGISSDAPPVNHLCLISTAKDFDFINKIDRDIKVHQDGQFMLNWIASICSFSYTSIMLC